MRTPSLLLACFTSGFIGAAAFQATLAPKPVTAGSADADFNSVTVKELAILGSNGKPRLQAFIDDENAVHFSLVDKNGNPRVLLSQDDEAQGVSLLDSTGTPRVMQVHMESGESVFAMQHGKDKDAVNLVASKEATMLRLVNAKGKESVLSPDVE